jgi:hypothetical protein
VNRQEAMTSKQAMPIRNKHAEAVIVVLWLLIAVVLMCTTGCSMDPERAETLRGPYEQRQVFAVVPMRNESGSMYADGLRLADRMTEQFTLTRQVDTVPVNRVLAAMQKLGLSDVTAKHQALRLREALGVDGLVVGSLTAYDPYDPPKLGLNVELYLDPKHPSRAFDVRRMSRAASDRDWRIEGYAPGDQPVSALSLFYDAADPAVQDRMTVFAVERGIDRGSTSTDARLYRISTDLYSSFVAYEVCRRLMQAETLRLTPPAPEGVDGTRPDNDLPGRNPRQQKQQLAASTD